MGKGVLREPLLLSGGGSIGRGYGEKMSLYGGSVTHSRGVITKYLSGPGETTANIV